MSKRKKKSEEEEDEQQSSPTSEDNPVLKKKEKSSAMRIGITFDGETFSVPATRNPLAIYPITQWDFFDWAKNSSILNLIWLFFPLPKWFFILHFLFWRLAYNLGIGYLLYRQSKDQFLKKQFIKWTKDKDTISFQLIKRAAIMGMGKDFDFYKVPPEFNAWLLFRHFVDFVLAYDFLTYIVFALRCWETPEITFTSVVCYILGIILCIFALWAKTDSYRVVKDFAWYWGDFFFLIKQKLTFDRVFSISPHPMYTIGYSFFYGCTLIAQSHLVLFISLLAHFCQLAFLSYVENPHIDKIYPGMIEEQETTRKSILYDTKAGYFRKDLIVFKNLDLFRSSDLFMIIILSYCILLNFFSLPLSFYIGHVIIWRIIHSVGLGTILHLQSKYKFWTKRFLYAGYTKQYAFENWKQLYNLSLVVNHVVFVCCFFKLATFEFPNYGVMLIAQTFGLLLIGINLWSSVSTFEVLGDFGWFYGDFFIDEVPSMLYYTGIYRFINNPDSTTGFAGYYGLALFSGSWTIFLLALFAQGLNALFVRFVEHPHMRKLYGNQMRRKSGFREAFGEIAREAVETSPQLQKFTRSASDLFKHVEGEIKEKVRPFLK